MFTSNLSQMPSQKRQQTPHAPLLLSGNMDVHHNSDTYSFSNTEPTTALIVVPAEVCVANHASYPAQSLSLSEYQSINVRNEFATPQKRTDSFVPAAKLPLHIQAQTEGILHL